MDWIRNSSGSAAPSKLAGESVECMMARYEYAVRLVQMSDAKVGRGGRGRLSGPGLASNLQPPPTSIEI